LIAETFDRDISVCVELSSSSSWLTMNN